MPLVSILIPVIRTDWLNEAIGSAVNQTFKDVEIIVSDDTAGDKVETLVSRWDDPRIKYVKNPQQGKMGTNRDFIISQAQGEYIKHLFDDDFLYPHSIEMLLDMLRETKCKLAFHSRNVVDLNSNVIGQPRFRMKTQHESFVDRFSRKIENKISRYFSSKESDYNKNDFCYISSQYFFDYMIARMSNHIGEPTNIIFHAPTFHDMRDKYTIVGTQMRFLTDVALYTNFVMQGHGIVGTSKIASAYRKHGQQTSNESNPRYSAGLFEWEFMARHAVDSGYMTREQLSAMRSRLRPAYVKYADNFSELKAFIDLAEPVPGALALDETFLNLLSIAHKTIDGRLAERRLIKS